MSVMAAGGRRNEIEELSGSLTDWALVVGAGVVVGLAVHLVLRGSSLRWTWALLLVTAAPLAGAVSVQAGVLLGVVGTTAATVGIAWQRQELERGGVEAQRERERVGPARLMQTRRRLRTARDERVSGSRLAIGQTPAGRVRTIPFGSAQGVRGLVVGAPGSGKTVTTAAIASAYAQLQLPIVCVDPKGDPTLRDALERAARESGAEFAEWSHEGPTIYNPFSRGDATEIADKALAGETWTEPHYLRQAQRYLGWELRVMQEAGIPVSLRSVAEHMDAELLDAVGDRCAREVSDGLRRYLASLSQRQRADLGGVRDRLAVLGESSLGRWLDPTQDGERLDLAAGWAERKVIYFRLDADRYPLASEMLGGAIVSDLVSLTGELQRSARLGLVAIDEFAALGAREVRRVLSRSRSAGISVLLATQGLADLGEVGTDAGGEGFARRVLTQLDFAIAHRQPEPEAASLLASVAGTRPVWVTTRRVDSRITLAPQSSTGTRTREREFVRHPDEFKSLATGEAIVIEPSAAADAEVVRVWPVDAASRRKASRRSVGVSSHGM